MIDHLLIRVMVAMALSDRELDPAEKAGIRDNYKKLTGQKLPKSELKAAINGFQQDNDDTLELLKEACASLEKHQKEVIMCGAYLVLIADGVIAAEEKNKLRQMADALKMPEIHYQAVLERLVSS